MPRRGLAAVPEHAPRLRERPRQRCLSSHFNHATLMVTIGKVASPRLELRRDPSTDHHPIVLLPEGAEVEILGQEGPWYKVRFADQVGYVSSGSLEIRAPNSSDGRGMPVAAGASFLLARPELHQISLQPATRIALTPDMSPHAHAASRTWNDFGGLLGALSKAFEVPTAAAVAVLCVESGGIGFKDQRLVIRFENHVFFKYWGKDNPARFAEHFAFDPQKKWKEHKFRADASEPWGTFHGDQQKEWRVFEFARALDETAAIYSISMGAPQIMGFNHKRIGYRTAQEMFAAFNADIRYHILGMFDFIRGDRAMVDALKNHRFEQFAALYNGPGQAARYGSLIQHHCEACRPLLPDAAARIA